jgi:hypothetical protein
MVTYPNADTARAQDADQAVNAPLSAGAGQLGPRLPEQPLQGDVGHMTLLGVCRRSGEQAGRKRQAAGNRPDQGQTARVRAGNLGKSLGTADFNNVHFAEGIRTVAIYRPPFLGAKNIPIHQGELLAGDIDQNSLRDPQ